MTEFIQLILTGLMMGSIYGLVAVGIVVLFKAAGIFNIAQGEILMFFAFVLYSFLVQLHLPFVVAALLTLIAAAALGILMERFPIRPMVGQPMFSIVIATIGIMLILRGVVSFGWGVGGVVSYPQGIFPKEAIRIGDITLPQVHVWAFVVVMITLLILTLIFRFTKMGLRMRAVGEGHKLAQSVGINVNTSIAAVSAIACVLASVGGFFLGSIHGLNTMLGGVGLAALPAALVGGFDSIVGAIIGGFVIGIAESLVAAYVPFVGLRGITPYIVVMLVLMIRPYGLFGQKQIERV